MSCHFSLSVLGQLDNADLWENMGQVLAQRQGTMSLRKVKTHVSNHEQQCQYLTEGNSRANALAKSCAKEKLRVKISCFRDLISQAVGLQVHLVTTPMSRTERFAHDDLERFNSDAVLLCTPCTPTSRAVKNFSVHRCVPHFSGGDQTWLSGNFFP